MSLHMDLRDPNNDLVHKKLTLNQKDLCGMKTSRRGLLLKLEETDKSHLNSLTHFLYNTVAQRMLKIEMRVCQLIIHS